MMIEGQFSRIAIEGSLSQKNLLWTLHGDLITDLHKYEKKKMNDHRALSDIFLEPEGISLDYQCL